MDGIVRKLTSHPSLSLGGAVLWGMIEFVALRRSQWMLRGQPRD